MPKLPLRKSVTVVAAADGTATFVFESPLRDHYWSGSVQIPAAPGSSSTSIIIGTNQWTPLIGSAGTGVQILEGEQMTLSASGLTAGISYTANLIGQDNTAPDVPDYVGPSPSGQQTHPSTGVGSPTHTRVAANGADDQLLASNPKRKFFSVQVDPGASNLYLIYGAGPASATNYDVWLEGGTVGPPAVGADYFEDPTGWTGPVHGFWDGSTGGCSVTEWATP